MLRSERVACLDRLRLHVDRHGDVRDAAIGERRAAGELDHVLDVRRPHDARVVDARRP